MTFYELFGMGVPLLVPARPLLVMLTRLSNFGSLDMNYTRLGWFIPKREFPHDWTETASLTDLQWWLSLSDLDAMPHLLKWSSVPELLVQLSFTDLEHRSAQMRRYTQTLIVKAVDFWRWAFLKAMRA